MSTALALIPQRPAGMARDSRPLTLTKLIDMYIDYRNQEREIGHELSKSAKRHYTESIRAFELFLDRTPTIADLNVETINLWLSTLFNAGKRPAGIKCRRTAITVLFRFAKMMGLVVGEPARVRRIRVPRHEIEGYDVKQMQTLLGAFGARQGRLKRCGLDQRIYYLSLLVVLWDTGLRIGDIPFIRVDKFNPEGLIWAHEHKTGKARWRRLSATGTELVGACISLESTRELIWPGHNAKSLARSVNRIIRAAGLPGTTKWIRRGSSSEVDRLHPGQGWRFLAHSTPSVFENHYRIARVCDDGSIVPTPLTLA